MNSEYNLSSYGVEDRPGEFEFFDLAELHAWAMSKSRGDIAKALPPAESGGHIQRAMLPSYIQNHVRNTFSEDKAERFIRAHPERYTAFSEQAIEAAPVWVVSSALATEADKLLEAAIQAGELRLYDELGGCQNDVSGVQHSEPTKVFMRRADVEAIKKAHATPTPGTIKDVPPEQIDRSHVSDWLALLNQAARRWWANADRQDPATHPSNASVAAWLIEKGMTKSLAERAASIIRPEWAHTGRKPDA